MISSRNAWVLIVQLLLLQFLIAVIWALTEINMKATYLIQQVDLLFGKDTWQHGLYPFLVAALAIIINFIMVEVVPALLVGYGHAAIFKIAIPLDDKKKIALVTALFWTVFALVIRWYYGNEDSMFAQWQMMHKIIVALVIVPLYTLFSYFITRYFLHVGESWYLKRH